MRGLIQYHLLAGGRTASQLVAARTLPAFLGSAYPLQFDGVKSGVMVSGLASQAEITAPDQRACASIVHKVDMVLLPAGQLADLPGDDISLAPAGGPSSS